METMLRNAFQHLGKSRTANRMARKYGLKFGAGRFVAGETIEHAIRTVRRLNGEGLMATLDHLGEFVGTEAEAAQSADMCIRTLEAIAESGVDSNLSLKLTSLGLDLNEETCLRNMRAILETARKHGNFVRIDMEDFSHCQQTLDLYRRLREEFDNVGVVIQAYLYRSEQDIADLAAYRANMRLVKGAYKESPRVAYPEKKQVDDNYRKIIRQQLNNGNYAAIATHDESVVEEIKGYIWDRGIPHDKFEFQMLYGIAEDLQRRLVGEGYRVRVYVPYGIDWFGYFMRRLAERPANVWFVLKNLFR
ncbi:proline dehydrogenase family protein [Cohnella candidum]|uniref:proline dehydrogenase n=1 Tax=Cohnella candidum TaxID=2674991 RepID=A0A3G3K2C0_9BACL|nr:proline dehydrogenase [Cohnella candidum]AYQ73919.1 proline dehydrogenase [Cohnella candidum]